MLHTVTVRALVLAACAGLLACNTAALAAPERARPEPQRVAQDAQRTQDLQRELEAARERARSDAAAIAQLRAEVDEAQGSRAAASRLAATLGVVLALLLAWLALRWYRVHQVERVGRWFRAQGTAGAGTAGAVDRPPTVGLQELIDVHDKSDFFLSIGEPEQAVGLLESHVRGPAETGALAWLDLLELYHRLGKRAAYDHLRADFRRRFTVQVPEFERFGEPTPTLEDYGRALSRIVALWPSQRVLQVIEESIFRRPGAPDAEPFSLDAYRELVLLHHVARDLASPQDDAQDPTRPARSDTLLQPLNGLDAQEPAQAQRDRLMIPPASPHLGVDIDLDEPVAQQAPLDFDFSAYDDPEGRKPG